MPIKPSKALLQVFEDECNHTCAKYRYWWSVKSSKMPYARHTFEQCVQDCIRKTVDCERLQLQSDVNEAEAVAELEETG